MEKLNKKWLLLYLLVCLITSGLLRLRQYRLVVQRRFSFPSSDLQHTVLYFSIPAGHSLHDQLKARCTMGRGDPLKQLRPDSLSVFRVKSSCWQLHVSRGYKLTIDQHVDLEVLQSIFGNVDRCGCWRIHGRDATTTLDRSANYFKY